MRVYIQSSECNSENSYTCRSCEEEAEEVFTAYTKSLILPGVYLKNFTSICGSCLRERITDEIVGGRMALYFPDKPEDKQEVPKLFSNPILKSHTEIWQV